MPKHYYQGETKKALLNFPLSYGRVSGPLLVALFQIKIAAARANAQTKRLHPTIAKALVRAGNTMLEHTDMDQFPLPALQGGAGTSLNMNVNEVLASLAEKYLNHEARVHPIDHANASQSTNDVCPSALRISAYTALKGLLQAMDVVIGNFADKAREFRTVQKLARTHLQDAVVITLGKEFRAYADVVKAHRQNLRHAQSRLLELNLGGTVVGTSENASPAFRSHVYRELANITGIRFRPAKNLVAQTSSVADFLIASQAVAALGADLSKIASDIRLMSSGPRGGFGELVLPEIQKGSSIVPGKVNPVICELVNQWFFLVAGNNLAIQQAVEAGQLELNVMFSLVADKLIQTIQLSTEVCTLFAKKCINHIQANKHRCLENLKHSTAYSALFIPLLGYNKVEKIVKEVLSSDASFKELILRAGVSERDWRKITE